MQKETFSNRLEIEPLADGLAKTFIQRWDLYARQMNDGSYICVREPLQRKHLLAHLRGEITLGAYVLNQDSLARYIVIDADDNDQLKQLIQMAESLASQGAPTYLENSHRGGHLWLFFSQPVTGKDARRFGQNLLKNHDLEKIELFPKQEKLNGGPGSLIRLPFGVHRKAGKRYGFLTVDLKHLEASFSKQIALLCAPKTVPEGVFKDILAGKRPKDQKDVSTSLEMLAGPLSKQIKDSTTVFDFVSQYVELSPNGRGRCPFHDDQHVSFAVNTTQNYWHCFAGCGGGSIIDFWMKLQDCDFKTAVRQLAQMLL